MKTLYLTVFGPARAALDGGSKIQFRTIKSMALLVYLAVESSTTHRRESLMTMLWPGMPERSARHNLRQVIYFLRQNIPEVGRREEVDEDGAEGGVELLVSNRTTISLNPMAAVEVDSVQFEALLDKTKAHDHVDILTCQICRHHLEQAVALYKGNFLSDFFIDDSNEFENWAESMREAYRRKVLDALEVLAIIATRQKDYVQARGYIESQLEIDNLRESGHRQLMEVLALSGRREEALAVYEQCQRLLAEEMGMAPSTRTTQIYEQILAGDLSFERPLTQGVRGYELKDEIGEGAYGSIHLAVQPSIGREVAVKVIRRRYANDPEFIRRFEAEAQTVARLEHPYVVPLYDYWRDPEGAYLVMRYLRGGSLLTSLEDGPWKLERTAMMLEQIAGALSAAHQQGVVHRDVKPANILLDEAGNA
ncbi:MAG: protein kinase [Chloroflexota bacterium]|nr:MAG: protein kinase [Chloroflexota bacterium]